MMVLLREEHIYLSRSSGPELESDSLFQQSWVFLEKQILYFLEFGANVELILQMARRDSPPPPQRYLVIRTPRRLDIADGLRVSELSWTRFIYPLIVVPS